MSHYNLNYEDFCADTARILITLYQRFPSKIELYVEDICGPEEIDEFGIHSDRHQRALAAIHWLKDESYIRFNEEFRAVSVDQCTLTAKGLKHLMKSVDQRPVAHLLQDAFSKPVTLNSLITEYILRA